MAAERAYLDHNASAPLIPAAYAAAVAALEVTANPSSVHAEGRQARRIIEEARASVAALVNGRPEHVVFTSGATEAASTLLTPDWQLGPERFLYNDLGEVIVGHFDCRYCRIDGLTASLKRWYDEQPPPCECGDCDPAE